MNVDLIQFALDIPRTPITSSMIRSAGWHGVLVIEFNNGSVYIYDAPKEYFDGMMVAESAGTFFHSSIKPLFEGTKIQEGS